MKRIISLVLALAMTFSLLTTAFATNINREEAETITRVGEVEELRERNSDTYALSDGSYQCVVYAEDKYFPDEAGKLIEIDNTLVATDYNTERSNYGYKNSANSFDVYFAENAPSVFISSKESSIAFTLIGAANTPAVVGGYGSADLVTDGNVLTDIAGYSLQGRNFICYSDVFPNVDVIYSVGNRSLKEYIILKNPNAPAEFSFLLDTVNCTVEENHGNVAFYNGAGEVVFQLAPLFAVDGNESYAPSFAYTLTENGDGTSTVTFSIPASYLNNMNRSFPVLVDPSIMVTGEHATYDTYVSSRYPTTNYYVNTWLRTGRDEDYYIRRTYIRFDLPYTIDGDKVSSAYINIRMYSGAVPSIKAYRVTENWTSDSLTWNNKPEYTSTDASLTATMSSNNWYRAYVTAIVKSWLKGTYRNDGFLLKDETESGTSQWTTFYSSDAASPNKPELIINYSSVRPLKTYDYYLYKNSAMSTSTTTLHNYLDIASDAIKSAYNVSFNRLSTTSSSAFNQRTGCTRTVSQICTSSSCGAVSECTDIHHKAGYYFLYVNKIGIAKVFRYVDYALCRTKSSKHGQIYGAASGDDKNVIISLQAPNIQRTTCHELSHCIGANDGVCVSGQACVMTYGSNVYNLWCTECAKDIANFLD